jgi:glycosyltransferase involved in cell wall biosynthesis
VSKARTPEVSVIMPVRNAEATVGPAVRSILAQTIRSWELLAVDDGSQDATVDVLRSFGDGDLRIQVLRCPRPQGIAGALNLGVSESSGRFIARMDGDDVAYPRRLEAQVRHLDLNPDIDLVGAGAMVFHGDGHARGARSNAGDHYALTSDVLNGIPLMHPTWMGKRTWFSAHPYLPTVRGWEDQELLLRSHQVSRFAAISDLLLGYREDTVRLRRSLGIRRQHAAHVLQYAMARGQRELLGRAMRVACVDAAKAVRDVAAVATGVQSTVLRARNRCPTQVELDQWNALWQAVGRPVHE